MFDDALVTVWSAPNYCYRCGNSASIMEVSEDGRTNFKVYLAAEENDSDPKNEAARRVSWTLLGVDDNLRVAADDILCKLQGTPSYFV